MEEPIILVKFRGEVVSLTRTQVERLLEGMQTITEVGQSCLDEGWTTARTAAPFMAGIAFGSLLGTGLLRMSDTTSS